jgi:methyltransferase (TIGR00027 family)
LFLDNEQTKELVKLNVDIFSQYGFPLPVFKVGGLDMASMIQPKSSWSVDDVAMMQVRTCFIDDTVRTFVNQYCMTGECNVVVLGAGYDTRFYRINMPSTVNMYEIDAVGTQTRKLKIIELSEIRDIPQRSRVQYVQVDFTKQLWIDVLEKDHDFSTNIPTVVVWEGITYYIEQSVVQATLKVIADSFTAPCAVAFDYPSATAVKSMGHLFKAINEPWVFGLEPEDMVTFVEDQGLRIFDHLSAIDGISRYFPTRATDGRYITVGSDKKYLLLAVNNHMEFLPESY